MSDKVFETRAQLILHLRDKWGVGIFEARHAVEIMEEHVRSTMRDDFAKAAIQGAIKLGPYVPADVARWAYELADAMLAERAK